MLRGIFVALITYFRKQEWSQTNNLNLQFKKLGNEEQIKPNASRKKEGNNKVQGKNQWDQKSESNREKPVKPKACSFTRIMKMINL